MVKSEKDKDIELMKKSFEKVIAQRYTSNPDFKIIERHEGFSKGLFHNFKFIVFVIQEKESGLIKFERLWIPIDEK